MSEFDTLTYKHSFEFTTDSSEDSIRIFGKNKDTARSNIEQLSISALYYGALQKSLKENQSSLIDTDIMQTSYLLGKLFSVGNQLEENFLYDYNYHTRPIKSRTLVGNFEFAGKGKTNFHFDIE